jgi:hypothetical protein
MDETDVALRERLLHSLQALAQEANIQERLFPDFAEVNDELILDFDGWRKSCVHNGCLSVEEAGAVYAIEVFISARPEDCHEPGSLQSHRFWAELRKKAIEALAQAGWPNEVPPSYAHEFFKL